MKKYVVLFFALFMVGCTSQENDRDGVVVEQEVVVTEVVKITATAVPVTDPQKSSPSQNSEPSATVVPTAVPTEEPTIPPQPTETETPAPVVEISVAAANIRSRPRRNAATIGVVEAGKNPELLGKSEDGSWYQVRTADGLTGWVGSSVARVVNAEAIDIVVSGGNDQETEPEPIDTKPAPVAANAASNSPIEQPVDNVPAAAGELATVVKIVDGDTIDVNINGQVERLRYIGIDTPEWNEPCGPEATQANANLVAGKTVRLEKDISNRDKYGRLLRYVYVGELLVEAELVRQGWADAYRYEPDTAQAAYLESLQAAAPARNCGNQAAAPPASNPTSPPPPPPPQQADNQPEEEAPQGANCSPHYPTVCIPPKSQVGDLDCGQISFRRFQVLQPDPHGFDGDNDGVGCESG